MKPAKKNIKLYANAAFSEDIQILGTDGQPKNITDWEFRLAAKIARSSAAADITGTATITDAASGIVNLYFEQADIELLLADGSTNKFMERWDLLCKPDVTYPVLVMYGDATVEAGSTPAW